MDWLAWKANTRFIRVLLGTSVRSAMALRGAFLVEMLFMALNNLIFFIFWWALFLKVPSIRGHELADVATLFGFVAISYGLHVVVAGGASELAQLILDGELDTHITRPKSILVAVLGSRSRASGVGDVLSGILLIAAFGGVSLRQVPILFLAVAASTATLTATVTLFSSLAFWLGQVRALVQQAFELLLSFSLYPKVLFGGVIKVLMFTAIPAGFVAHVPVALIQKPRFDLALLLVAASAFYALLARWIFGCGLRRYASGSRFAMHG